jgi:hypothetical protein
MISLPLRPLYPQERSYLGYQYLSGSHMGPKNPKFWAQTKTQHYRPPQSVQFCWANWLPTTLLLHLPDLFLHNLPANFQQGEIPAAVQGRTDPPLPHTPLLPDAVANQSSADWFSRGGEVTRLPSTRTAETQHWSVCSVSSVLHCVECPRNLVVPSTRSWIRQKGLCAQRFQDEGMLTHRAELSRGFRALKRSVYSATWPQLIESTWPPYTLEGYSVKTISSRHSDTSRDINGVSCGYLVSW